MNIAERNYSEILFCHTFKFEVSAQCAAHISLDNKLKDRSEALYILLFCILHKKAMNGKLKAILASIYRTGKAS